MVDADYPRTMAEFDWRFSSAEACRQYLVQVRWPSGFRCPRCSSAKAWLLDRGLMNCKCGQQTSVTAGTIFHRTRKPLRLWFQVMWWVTGQKNGASALGLQRILGLGLASQAPTSHGTAGSRSARRRDRSGRDARRRSRGRRRPQTPGNQGFGGGCRFRSMGKALGASACDAFRTPPPGASMPS